MRRAEKAERIGKILDELFPETPIPLQHVDPFTLLIAVMLSAQTTDKKVNEVTPKLFARGPTPEAMSQMEVDEIRDLIREVGLAPTKAKHLKRTAEMLYEAGSVVPSDLESLEAFPGVGHKTAQVVQAQAFRIPSFPVDTHIHRLATRWGLTNGRNVKQTELDLKKLFPVDTWIRRHLQIIYFGRERCPARSHTLEDCPICGWAATKKRMQAEAQRRGRRATR